MFLFVVNAVLKKVVEIFIARICFVMADYLIVAIERNFQMSVFICGLSTRSCNKLA